MHNELGHRESTHRPSSDEDCWDPPHGSASSRNGMRRKPGPRCSGSNHGIALKRSGLRDLSLDFVLEVLELPKKVVELTVAQRRSCLLTEWTLWCGSRIGHRRIGPRQSHESRRLYVRWLTSH